MRKFKFTLRNYENLERPGFVLRSSIRVTRDYAENDFFLLVAVVVFWHVVETDFASKYSARRKRALYTDIKRDWQSV